MTQFSHLHGGRALVPTEWAMQGTESSVEKTGILTAAMVLVAHPKSFYLCVWFCG